MLQHPLLRHELDQPWGGELNNGLEQLAQLRDPLRAGEEQVLSVTKGGSGKSSLIDLQLSPEVEAGALRVVAFLFSYYGTSDASDIAAPAPTITTRDH